MSIYREHYGVRFPFVVGCSHRIVNAGRRNKTGCHSSSACNSVGRVVWRGWLNPVRPSDASVRVRSGTLLAWTACSIRATLEAKATSVLVAISLTCGVLVCCAGYQYANITRNQEAVCGHSGHLSQNYPAQTVAVVGSNPTVWHYHSTQNDCKMENFASNLLHASNVQIDVFRIFIMCCGIIC